MNPGNINKPAFQLARVEEGEELYQQTEIIMIGDGASRAAAHTMSRRDFLGVTITAGAALAFLNGCGRDEAPPMQTVIAETESLVGSKALVLGAHKDDVYTLAISPDGTRLVSRGAEKTIKLWSLNERVLIKALQGYDNSGCISPDGKLLVLGNSKKGVELWSLSDGALVKTLTGHARNIGPVCISADGNLLVTGGEDGTIKVWSFPQGDLIRTLAGHTGEITSLCVSPDGKLLASGSSDKSFRLWSLPDGELLKRTKRSSNYIRASIELTICHDGKQMISRGWDANIQLWSLPEGKLLKTLQRKDTFVACFAISPDGKLLAEGNSDRDQGIRLWSLPAGNPVRALNIKNPHSSFYPSLISPEGEWLVYLDNSSSIGMLRLPDGSAAKRLEGHTDRVNSVCISPDGKLLASGSKDKTIRLWSFPDGKFISCLADAADNPESTKGAVFSVISDTGQTVTYTLPCGAAIPAGATCTCNCVPGSIKPPAPAKSTAPSSSSGGGSYRGGGCSCNPHCVCMAVRCRRT